MKTLRPYQLDAVLALWEYWKAHPDSAPLLVCPTGAGKSLICAEICRRLINLRILVVSHRKEIIEQNAKELHELLNCPIGVYSAGLGKKILHKITCANIQSIYKLDLPKTDLIIIDEAHLLSSNADSMYRKFLEKQPHARVLGLTATPYRMDQGHLVGDLFSEIVYDIKLPDLIDQGYLSPLISIPSKSKLDFSRVRKSGNDYNLSALEETFFPHTDQQIAEILATDRKHILVFCSGVKHAREIAAAAGGDYVTGEMLPMERDRKINKFKSGETRLLANVDVLTTGFNFPSLDCIVLLRATQSIGLYVQIVGRGSRIADDKENCLILDFGGNIERHGPIDLIEVKAKKGVDAQFSIAPVKACEQCGAIVAISVMRCPGCGYEFPASSCKLVPQSAALPIISTPANRNRKDIDNVDYRIHRKEGKPPSLRVIYSSGKWDISQYLCFEHGGYTAQKANETWGRLRGALPAPATTLEAFHRVAELHVPNAIEIKRDGKYERIVSMFGLSPRDESLREELGI